MITENGLFNLEPKTHDCKRQIPFYDISKISCSLLDDNFFIIHVPNEYDYLMVSSNKTEIISLVSLLYLWSCGDPLKVRIDPLSLGPIQRTVIISGIYRRGYLFANKHLLPIALQ